MNSRKRNKTAEKLSNDLMTVKFSNLKKEDFDNTVNQIKSISGRKFSGTFWTLPISRENLLKLLSWGFALDRYLYQILGKIPRKNPVASEKYSQIESQIFEDLEKKTNVSPYPFQKAGIARIEFFNGRALVADEMRLGKTVQVLLWIALHPEKTPIIIICPATLKITWKREILKWKNKRAYIVTGRNSEIEYQKYDHIIINYDILESHLDNLINLNPQILIVDECHYLRNLKTKRTKAVRKLGKYCEHIIALSGTPIQNRPYEFYSILSLLRKDIFNSFYQFTQRYCSPEFNGYAWEYKGASNTEELHEILKNTLMIRRTRKDVIKELPKEQRITIATEISNRKEYTEAERDIVSWIAKNLSSEKAERASRAETLAKFNYLKQLAVKGKMNSIIEWIDNFLEQEKKLVVFCTHHETIDILMEKYKAISVKLDGRDSAVQKQKSIDSFQGDPDTKLLIGNIQAAGQGTPLHTASDVLFCELDWIPGNHDQAEKRIYTIGKTDSLGYYYIIAENTIENDIIEILDEKRQKLDAVLDGRAPEEDTLLSKLLEKYKERIKNEHINSM